MADFIGGTSEADHLVVLVHGLWGSPHHMHSIAKALRAEHGEKVHILITERNSGSYTYDGIETGGERVCHEIEEELVKIKQGGGKIKKLSIAGYSLGGLVARYAIGLLYAKGDLDNLECMNFTAFASPFLGVRSPLLGHFNHVWNLLGARTLCLAGRQLFGIDKFRDTGKPLVAVLADPNSIFMCGLAKFKRRSLYANIVKDRSAVYYTTAIAKTDPYVDLSKVKVNYLEGYQPIILDPENPVEKVASPELSAQPPTTENLVWSWIKRIPMILGLSVLIPIGILAFLANSAVQTVRSASRIKLHESGKGGVDVKVYRAFSPLIKDMKDAIGDGLEDMGTDTRHEYIDDVDQEGAGFPTLALAPYQFAAIQALDNLGWRKNYVWIHDARHSHAAIVVRVEREDWYEGKVVLSHWVTDEFLP
ncbi:putative serine esterase-domain-containing protein [Cladorrhinum samala]|uniref:Serine esterase-domain-containing protein n=1 Tax=Cladorrhinum samala TaxID=585594 RepID=A0AAV9HRC5_9PEZI|nr:putative serine esterase-domain-containing protein [Cladorrhinum samala]